MKKYLGVKEIKAKPMILKDAAKKLNRATSVYLNNNDHNIDQDGYLVEYEGGYQSWSPKDVFEDAYREIDGLTFGLAIEALKLGRCIARKGWNGKDLFVCKQVPSEINANIIPKMQSLPQSAKNILHDGIDDTRPIFYVNQMIIVNNKTRSIDSWVASSSDTFAEDWVIIE